MSVIKNQVAKLQEILDGKVDRRVLLTLHQQLKTRIFDGFDSSNSQIGRYSAPYIKRRVKRGLGGNPKVILEFTGQMKNDFLLLEENNGYGSGFSNDANGDKSFWVEDTYDKRIFDLSDNERELLEDLYEQQVNQLLNG